MDNFRCPVAQLLATHQEPRQVRKRGRRDPGHETVPNNGKTTNHLQAKGNEATNSLQQENLLRNNSKGGNATTPEANNKPNDDRQLQNS